MRFTNRPNNLPKPTQNHKHSLIRIDTPNTKHQTNRYCQHPANNLHGILHEEIEKVKNRVIRSKIALQDSRRQHSSPEKLLESDRIGLVFNHAGSANKTQYQKIYLEGNSQPQDDSKQEQSQGKIQLPFHIDNVTHMRHTLSTSKDFDHLNSSRDYFSNKYKEKKGNFLIIEDFRKAMSKDKKSKENIIKKDQSKKISDQAIKHQNARKYRELFGRSKDLIRYKEDFNKSLEDKKSHNFKTQTFFLNLSQERLPIYLAQERSISKQRKAKIKAGVHPDNDRKIVKLNNPNLNQSARYSQTKQFKLKPRYQIQVPTEVKQANPKNIKYKEEKPSKDLFDLRQKVEKYEFVRKHLSSSDLFMIYEFLKKNQISEEKWPLFVVQEAYKKMSMSKHK